MGKHNPMYQLHLDSDESKDSLEYGLKVAKKIESEWQKGYYERRNNRFNLYRSFARGRQPMAEYLSYLGIDGKESYVNLDMKPLAIAPKFMQVLLGGFMKRMEKPRAKAMDPISTKEKKNKKADLMFFMKERDIIREMEQMSGVEVIPEGMKVPETEEELELLFGLEYKIPEEILFEKGISTVLEQNDWDVIKRKVLEDLAEVGLAVTKVYPAINGAIKIRRVIPENFVSSFSEYDDGRDLQWCGEIVKVRVSDLKNRYRHLTDEDIEDIVSKSRKVNPRLYRERTAIYNAKEYDDDFVTLIDFEFKTTKSHIYQSRTNKYGNKIVEKKEKMPQRVGEGKEIIHKDIQVIYHGVYVMDTDIMIKWDLQKNMIKKDSPAEIADVHFTYSMYMPQNDNMENISLPERMTTSIKAMTVVHLKLMQLIAKLRPAGIAVDIDNLQSLSLGNGKDVNPLEVQAIYDQTGTLYYRGIKEDGETRQGPPIMELPNNGSAAQINTLVQLFNVYLDRLRDEIGINEYREGTSVNPKTGLGVMQSQVAASNNATDFLYEGYNHLFNNTAKKMAILLYDSVVYGGRAYREYFAERDIKGRDFDIQIEMLPDDRDRQFLEAMITTALSANQLDFEDAFRIRHIDNVKLGEYYLAKARKRKLEEDMAMAQQNSQMNAQIQQESAAAKAQMDAQLKQLESQAELQITTIEAEMKQKLSEQEFVQELMLESFKAGRELPDSLAQYVMGFFEKKAQEEQAKAQAEAQAAQEAQLQQMVEEMRAQGMSDEEIQATLQQMQSQEAEGQQEI